MSKTKDRISVIMIVIGSLLIVSCLCLIWWNYDQSRKAEKAAEQELAKVEDTIDDRINGTAAFDSSKDDKSSISFIKAQIKKMPVVEIDGNDYIGYLYFPTLDLRLPVMNTYNESKLNIAPCRYFGSLETDDLVIAGHNFYGGFDMLDKLKKGDKLTFTNMDGKTFEYTVGDTEMLKPLQVTDMVENDWDLSLYTCNYSGLERFTVRCRLAD